MISKELLDVDDILWIKRGLAYVEGKLEFLDDNIIKVEAKGRTVYYHITKDEDGAYTIVESQSPIIVKKLNNLSHMIETILDDAIIDRFKKED